MIGKLNGKVKRDLLNMFVGDWGSMKVTSITPGSSRDTEFSDVHAEIVEKDEVTCFQVTNLTGETIICAPVYDVLPSTVGNTILTVATGDYSMRLRFYGKKDSARPYKAIVKIGSSTTATNWNKTDVAMVVNTHLLDVNLATQFMDSYCQLLANTLGVMICYEFFGVGQCHFLDVSASGKLKPTEMGQVKLLHDFVNYACLQGELCEESEVENFVIDYLDVESK